MPPMTAWPEGKVKQMTDIDFGTLMAEVMVEIRCCRDSLTPEESRDADRTCRRYQSVVAQAIRRAFDEAERRTDN